MIPSRFITGLLIAIWLLTPDVLCLLPGVAMTMDEHACCEQMGALCGNVPMPNLHECCRTVTGSAAVLTAKVTEYPELLTSTVPFIIPDLIYSNTLSIRWLRVENQVHRPLIPNDSFNILRI